MRAKLIDPAIHTHDWTEALIDAEAKDLPGHGLEQGKAHADALRLNVPCVFARSEQ
jgi:hypothetical protein